MDMRFPAKKNAGCPKEPQDFPPLKDGIFQPPSYCPGTPLSLPQSLYGNVPEYLVIRGKMESEDEKKCF